MWSLNCSRPTKCDEGALLSDKADLPEPKSTQSSQRGSVESSAEPHFLAVGRISRPHGVQGEVRVELLTDHPERFEWLEAIYVGEQNPRLVPIESVRHHQGVVLLKLAGYPSRTEAELLRGELLQVLEADAVPLAEDEYYLFRLIGVAVYTEDGKHLGRLSEILETGANNVFVVEGEERQYLLPDIRDVVKEIDLESGRMTIHPMPGLLD